jgi:phospholipase C
MKDKKLNSFISRNPSGQRGKRKRAAQAESSPRKLKVRNRSRFCRFLAVSPFSKPHYVSHTVGDHTSLLALIEKRFLSLDDNETNEDARPHLTRRDLHANTLEDLFDFEHSPSLDTAIVPAAPPAKDCTPVPH